MRCLLALLLPLLAVADLPLAQDGQPRAAIVAPDALRASADLLADHLHRITGAEFPRAAAAGQPALRLALAQDEPRLAGRGPGAYLLRTGATGLDLVGNSPKAVQDGVYDLLGRLGCRWLQPGQRWTVIPALPTLALPDLDLVTAPAFAHRDIWYAYGPGIDESREVLSADYQRWVAGNRLGGHAPFKSGHTYPNTVGKHLAEFQAHPEYFAQQENGERLKFGQHQSLCSSNPDVAKLFIADKLAELRTDRAANPLAYTVSMDPNDGSVACHCQPCRALGNGSDQTLHLANQVARALREEFPDAIVSFYVYASHRLPPERVKAEPNVYVQVATAFNKSGLTLDELVKRWRETVTAVGVRDYLGVEAWDWGLPGRARGTRFGYVREAIPRFLAWGAIAYNAELNINWGAQGPATTTAARLLWDPTADAQALYDDWFHHAYGPAAATMKSLYALFERNQDLTRQNLHDWFRLLDQALREAESASPAVQGRLTDQIVLLHYALLYRDWERARASGDRAAAYRALEPMLTFTWRSRERGIVHAYGLQRRLVNSGDAVLRPLADGWHFKDPKAVWKHPEALTDAELREIFRQDLAATPPDTRRRDFAGPLTLVPDPDGLTQGAPHGGFLRGSSRWEVLIPADAPLKLDLPMEGVRFPYRLVVLDEEGEEVARAEHTVQAEERYQTVRFTLPIALPGPGRYRFDFTAGEDYRPDFPAAWHVALTLSETHRPMLRFFGPATLYVPVGTEKVLLEVDGRVSLHAPRWNGRRDFDAAARDPELDCLVIPVTGELPQVWLVTPATSGSWYPLNLPPYLGRAGHPQLIPAGALPPAAH